MSVTKSTQSYTAERITLRSPIPYETAIKRLEDLTNRSAGENVPRERTSKEAFERAVNGQLGESGFMFFNAYNHSSWFSLFLVPDASKHTFGTYVIGNPLIARTLMERDVRAGLAVPPRVFIREVEGGTEIVWDLPSSIVALPGYGGGREQGEGEVGTEDGVDEVLLQRARELDEKMEQMFREVLRV